MKLKGQLSICRCSDHSIHIELNDVDSRLRVVDVRMSPEAFGNAVTGLGCQDATFEVPVQQLTERLGKKMEHKTVRVPFTSTSYDYKEERARFKEAVKPYEVDGWKCDDLDACNNCHRRGPDGITTTFRRYV